MEQPLGWATALVAADQIRKLERISPLQERLLLLVTLRQQRIDFLRTQLLAIPATYHEKAGPHARKMLDRYRNMVFPGIETEHERQAKRARKELLKEVNKVYIVKPKKDRRAAFDEMARSGTSALRQVGLSEAMAEEEKRLRDQARQDRARQRKARLTQQLTRHQGR